MRNLSKIDMNIAIIKQELKFFLHTLGFMIFIYSVVRFRSNGLHSNFLECHFSSTSPLFFFAGRLINSLAEFTNFLSQSKNKVDSQ